ncbi:predicted protein [Chaetomium globosum CBS 148.51]|uniref:DUF7025 domain-containing protein n=1 Tax=Chaetomium globosum (strain ATCC 6205 / CBS 148.51 / DSM 1962 / NBRC 6347 / NRRL 1970) TaxID=306901 RepID=Q2H375_CHAGB|nr:uncharacterized protein CHGG_03771 [Chaetomium globosum CBS 148.51]EAQ87152.1 predicted protein [Chaetomium globosum CBS 148.51]
MDAADETEVRDPAAPAAESPLQRPRPSSSSKSEPPSPLVLLKWSTLGAPGGQSVAGNKNPEGEDFQGPSDMRDIVGTLMARIDKLEGAVSGLREVNAEFEIRLRIEGQLRRDLEIRRRASPFLGKVRITSEFIVNFLPAMNLGLESSSRVFGHGTSVLMVLPFKGLVHFGDRIRKEFRRLSKIPAKKPEGGGAVQSDVLQPNIWIQNQPDATLVGQSDERSGHMAARMDHFKCLLEFMDGNFKTRMDHIRGGFCERITYAELWLLFQSGDVIVWKEKTQASLVLGTVDPGHKITQPFYGGSKSSQEKVDGFEMVHVMIGFDGTVLGPVTSRVTILPFNGEKAITSLAVYPLAYSPNPGLRESLIASGKRFLDMTKVRHMHYTGPTSASTPDYVDSQVVVDFEECYRQNPQWRPDIQNLVGVKVEDIGFEVAIDKQYVHYIGHFGEEEEILDERKIDQLRTSSLWIATFQRIDPRGPICSYILAFSTNLRQVERI